MDKDLEDAVYSDEYDKVLSIVMAHPELLNMAIMLAVRYDKSLLISELEPIAKADGLGARAEFVRDATISILENAILEEKSHTINSMIHSDILNLYLLIEAAAKADSLRYYRHALEKLGESGMEISSDTWDRIANICMDRGVSSSRVFEDVVTNHGQDIDVQSLALKAVSVRASSKLDTLLSYKEYMDMEGLIIYSIQSGCNHCAEMLLKKYDGPMNRIVETAVTSKYDDIASILDMYEGDITNLVLLAINSDNDLYSFLVKRVKRKSYSIICVALVQKDMIEEMIDLVDKVDDVTPILEEMVRSGYHDLLEDVLDMQPQSVDYLPIMTIAYQMKVYDEVVNTLFSHERYMTELVKVYNTILTEPSREAITKIRRVSVSLHPLLKYVEQLRMYDVARQISLMSRYK